MGLETREQKTFLQVISDGSIRKVVPEGTPGCVRREYEDRETKEVKHKFELVFSAINGMIGKISLNKGKYGDQLIIPITDGDEVYNLALSTQQNFGEDFMKKMPNINFDKPVRLSPFSFVSDAGKTIRGVDVRQDWNPSEPNSGNKIPSHYQEGTGRDTKNVNGYPEPDGDTKTFSTDDWKIYFAIARKFLVNNLKTKGLIVDSAVAATAPIASAAKEIAPEEVLPEEEINPEDIPF